MVALGIFRRTVIFSAGAIGSAIVFFNPASVWAVQFPNGTVSFEKSPRLTETATTFNGVRIRHAKYYFTLELPTDAGEALKKVIIRQRQGTDEIRFRLDETFAFEGTRSDRGENLPIASVSQDQETDAISVVFEGSISPGKTVTIGLKPKQNPDYGGIYLFGVTAFPTGEKPYGLYLGSGRLHFYDHSDFIGK